MKTTTVVGSAIGHAGALAMVLIACGSSGNSNDDAGREAAGNEQDAALTSDANGRADGIVDSAANSERNLPDAACGPIENDAGTCSALEAIGPMVTSTCLSAEPPQPVGGTIEDGIYVEQAITFYGGCPTVPVIESVTWSVCGNHWDTAMLFPTDPNNPDAGTQPVIRINTRPSVAQASVVLYLACASTPVFPLGTRPFTASPGHLTFIYQDLMVCTGPGPSCLNNGSVYRVASFVRQ